MAQPQPQKRRTELPPPPGSPEAKAIVERVRIQLYQQTQKYKRSLRAQKDEDNPVKEIHENNTD